jgi:hypothetical protein
MIMLTGIHNGPLLALAFGLVDCAVGPVESLARTHTP